MTAVFHPRTPSSANIAIAGAGLMGLVMAWRLTELGHRVAVFDSGSITTPKNAAHTAAAMLSPMSEVVVSERAIYDIGIHSMVLWESWLNERPTHFGSLYSKRGSLVVAHAQDEPELIQFQQELAYHLGVGAKNACTILNSEALQALEPDLAGHFQHGLYLPNEASLDNRAFLSQLVSYLKDKGAVFFEHCAITFTPAPESTNADLSKYDLWFDCRGVGAKPDQPVRGIRGEVLWVETEEVKLTRPIRLMHPRYKLYIVPKPNNRYIVGATEIESSDTSPMSVQSSLELCSALYTLNPAFAEARIIEMDTNLRPALLDNMPCVTLEPTLSNPNGSASIVRINGLYRHGFLLAPSAAEYALQLAGLSSAQSPFGKSFNRKTLGAQTPAEVTPPEITPSLLGTSSTNTKVKEPV